MRLFIFAVIVTSVACYAYDALSKEPQKRAFRPIPPVRVIELPKHDPKIKYYGPEDSLFPRPKLK